METIIKFLGQNKTSLITTLTMLFSTAAYFFSYSYKLHRLTFAEKAILSFKERWIRDLLLYISVLMLWLIMIIAVVFINQGITIMTNIFIIIGDIILAIGLWSAIAQLNQYCVTFIISEKEAQGEVSPGEYQLINKFSHTLFSAVMVGSPEEVFLFPIDTIINRPLHRTKILKKNRKDYYI